jgi:hypothetical protein
MEKSLRRIGEFAAGVYTWLISISLGMALLDIQYARLIPGERRAMAEVSDYLLWISAFTLVSGVAAILFTWESKTARNYFIGSLLVGFVIPGLFLLGGVDAPGFGPWLRIGSGGLAAVLAFMGLYRYYREG